MDLAVIKEMSSEWALLVCDFDEIARNNIKEWCYCFKSVTFTATKEEAAYKMKNEYFDVFIIDSKMFTVDIEKIFVKIRDEYPNTGLIISTDEIDIFPLRNIINFGLDAIALKPLVKENFLNVMHKALTKVFDRALRESYIVELEKNHCNFSLECKKSENTSGQIKKEILGKTHNVVDDTFEVILPKETHYAKIDFLVEHLDFYNNIANEDIEEMIDLLTIMESAMGDIFKNTDSIDSSAFQKFTGSIRHFGSTLMHYTLYSDIGSSMVRLSQDITPNENAVQSNRPLICEIFYALISVLQTFVHEVFEKHIPNPIVFNESIQNDISMIVEMIATPKEQDEGGELFFF